MNYTIVLSPTVSWTTVNEQTVLFSKSTGDFYGMNSTAAHLVQELLQSNFLSTVRKASQEFGVEEAQIQTDLQEVVDTLLAAKLVTHKSLESNA